MNHGYAGNGGSQGKSGAKDELNKPHEQNLKDQYGIEECAISIRV
jgi:hypothetical protein